MECDALTPGTACTLRPMEALRFIAAEAERFIDEGKPASADLIAREALSRNPRDAAAWNALSRVATAVGETDAAARYARVAQELSPPPAPPPAAGDRFVLIKAWGYGFCSDVDHVLGCLLLCEIAGRTPVTHWGANSLFGVDPQRDAFREYFEPLSPFTIDDLTGKGLDFWPPKWRDTNLRAERFQKQFGEFSRIPTLEMLNRPEKVVVSDYHSGVPVLAPWIRPGHPMHGKSIEEIYQYLVARYLRPVALVREMVDADKDSEAKEQIANMIGGAASMVVDEDARSMPARIGAYELKGEIGSGGMGGGYKAHHALLRRDTPIQLLPPDKADPAAIARFEQEVRLTCRLTHPNTIQVFDYGHTPDGIFYYAMEYLEGLNLHELVHRYGAQPEGRVVHILGQICESLNEAHGVGLIHRDIKPANIFVCDRGGVPDSVKVLDFGLVKNLSNPAEARFTREIPGEDGIVGTPNFIAPESIQDCNQSDARSDLYSLGALGYFLLTGHEVFAGDSTVELCRQHLTEKPLPPGARVGKQFDPQLEALLMRCLEKDPAARPQSAREMAQALAASPVAGQWATAQRAASGTEHRKSESGAVKSELRFDSLPGAQTVKIEFADRTA